MLCRAVLYVTTRFYSPAQAIGQVLLVPVTLICTSVRLLAHHRIHCHCSSLVSAHVPEGDREERHCHRSKRERPHQFRTLSRSGGSRSGTSVRQAELLVALVEEEVGIATVGHDHATLGVHALCLGSAPGTFALLDLVVLIRQAAEHGHALGVRSESLGHGTVAAGDGEADSTATWLALTLPIADGGAVTLAKHLANGDAACRASW